MQNLEKKKKIIIISIVIVFVILIGAVTTVTVVAKNNAKDKRIDEFKTYLESYTEEADKYILGDNQSEYNDLISRCEQTISNKNDSEIDQLETELKIFENNITKGNEQSLKDTLKEIKKIDTTDLDGKDEIKEKIEEANSLIRDKRFNEALDVIEDINILIEKDKKIVESEKQNADEAKKKADAIKVSNGVANRSNAEELVRNYLSSFDDAVNMGDFDNIQYYIYPNSSLYNEQKSLYKVMVCSRY